MKMRFHSRLLTVSIAFLALSDASAATWTGTTNASWATGTNWTGTPPDNTNPEAVVFDSSTTSNLTQALDASYTLTGIALTSPSGAVVVNSGSGTNTLFLGSGGIDMSAATQNLTLNVNTKVGSNQSWTVASGRTLLRSGGTSTFDTGTTTTLSGTGTITFGGTQVLTGAGDITVNGATLYNNLQGGTQSRTGSTTLSSGVIRIDTNVSLFGTGGLNLNGGAIGSGTATGRTFDNAVTIGGNIQIGGSSGGLSTSFIRFNGNTNLGGATREITAIATGLNSNFGTGAIFTGILSNGGITKAGSGTITLNNNGNTFTGATTVNAGNLAISQSALLNSSSVTLAASGAQLFLGENGAGTHTLNNLSGVAGSSIRSDFTLSGTNTNRSLTINQTVDGEFAGTFVQGGSRAFELVKTGTATLTVSGAGGHSLGTTISGGSLKITGAGLLGAPSYAGAITNNATLHFDATTAQTLTGTITGNGSLLKSNSGSLSISGTSSGFTGSTSVSGGILNINSAIGGNLAVTGGRLVLNSTLGGNVTGSSTGTLGGSGGSTGTLAMSGTSTFLLTGGATTTGLTFNGVTLADTVYLEFASSPDNATVYDVVTYGAGGLSGLANLTPLARGTVTNDTANSKITFTAGAPGTRTWNTGDGVWNRFGILTNWVEDDQLYYQGDDVIFDDIASNTVITLEGLLSPFSVTVENTANTYTFSGTGGLSGNGFFDKLEAGTLVIANSNVNFTGSTLIDSGLFRIIDGGSWGTGALINKGTVEIDRSTELMLSSAISGTGTLVKNGSGTLRLNGSNTYTGATILNSGILQAGANNAFGSGTWTINGGIVSSDSGTTRTLSNALLINANPSFGDGINGGQLVFSGAVDLNGATRTITSVLGTQGARFNGVISNGGITKTGTGRVTLANDSNTFTGATTINEGILATSIGALATSASVTLASGAELALGSNGTTLINNLNGAAGSLIVSNFNITADGARTLQVNQTVNGAFAGGYTQGANRVISLTKSGSATLALTSSQNYGGNTTVNQGTLAIASGGGIYRGAFNGSAVVSVASGATLELQSWGYQESTASLGGLANSAARVVIKGGTIRVTGTSTYGRGVTIETGGATFEATAGNTWTFDNTGDGNIAFVYNDNPSLAFAGDGSFVFNKSFSGTGALTKSGSGMLTLPAACTHTGNTSVTGGTLAVTGSLGNTAVTVASGATLSGNGNIGGAVTIEAGATHRLAVAASPAAQVTRLISGALNLSATGDILSLTAASTPANGTYIIATATGGITGSPESVNQSGVSGTFSIVGNNLILTVGASPFDTWAAANGLDGSPGKEADFDDDPDGDSVANGLEWILSGDPLDGQSDTLVQTTATSSGGLTLKFSRNENSIGEATLSVQYNNDLGPVWNNVAIGTATSGPDANGVTVTINTDAAPDQVTVNIPASNAPTGKVFARLRATQP